MIWNIRKKKTIRTARRKKIKKKKEPKYRLRSLWDNFKRSNIPIIEVPEGEEKTRNWKFV